jgi:hypothetical protein
MVIAALLRVFPADRAGLHPEAQRGAEDDPRGHDDARCYRPRYN